MTEKGCYERKGVRDVMREREEGNMKGGKNIKRKREYMCVCVRERERERERESESPEENRNGTILRGRRKE